MILTISPKRKVLLYSVKDGKTEKVILTIPFSDLISCKPSSTFADLFTLKFQGTGTQRSTIFAFDQVLAGGGGRDSRERDALAALLQGLREGFWNVAATRYGYPKIPTLLTAHVKKQGGLFKDSRYITLTKYAVIIRRTVDAAFPLNVVLLGDLTVVPHGKDVVYLDVPGSPPPTASQSLSTASAGAVPTLTTKPKRIDLTFASKDERDEWLDALEQQIEIMNYCPTHDIETLRKYNEEQKAAAASTSTSTSAPASATTASSSTPPAAPCALSSSTSTTTSTSSAPSTAQSGRASVIDAPPPPPPPADEGDIPVTNESVADTTVADALPPPPPNDTDGEETEPDGPPPAPTALPCEEGVYETDADAGDAPSPPADDVAYPVPVPSTTASEDESQFEPESERVNVCVDVNVDVNVGDGEAAAEEGEEPSPMHEVEPLQLQVQRMQNAFVRTDSTSSTSSPYLPSGSPATRVMKLGERDSNPYTEDEPDPNAEQIEVPEGVVLPPRCLISSDLFIYQADGAIVGQLDLDTTLPVLDEQGRVLHRVFPLASSGFPADCYLASNGVIYGPDFSPMGSLEPASPEYVEEGEGEEGIQEHDNDDATDDDDDDDDDSLVVAGERYAHDGDDRVAELNGFNNGVNNMPGTPSRPPSLLVQKSTLQHLQQQHRKSELVASSSSSSSSSSSFSSSTTQSAPSMPSRRRSTTAAADASSKQSVAATSSSSSSSRGPPVVPAFDSSAFLVSPDDDLRQDNDDVSSEDDGNVDSNDNRSGADHTGVPPSSSSSSPSAPGGEGFAANTMNFDIPVTSRPPSISTISRPPPSVPSAATTASATAAKKPFARALTEDVNTAFPDHEDDDDDDDAGPPPAVGTPSPPPGDEHDNDESSDEENDGMASLPPMVGAGGDSISLANNKDDTYSRIASSSVAKSFSSSSASSSSKGFRTVSVSGAPAEDEVLILVRLEASANGSGGEVIGCVSIGAMATLSDVRKLIKQELDQAPAAFSFLNPIASNAPVGLGQEARLRALQAVTEDPGRPDNKSSHSALGVGLFLVIRPVMLHGAASGALALAAAASTGAAAVAGVGAGASVDLPSDITVKIEGAAEPLGIVDVTGLFANAGAAPTLADLRELMNDDLDDLPAEYLFLWDGVKLSRKQEVKKLVALLPGHSVTIRDSSVKRDETKDQSISSSTTMGGTVKSSLPPPPGFGLMSSLPPPPMMPMTGSTTSSSLLPPPPPPTLVFNSNPKRKSVVATIPPANASSGPKPAPKLASASSNLLNEIRGFKATNLKKLDPISPAAAKSPTSNSLLDPLRAQLAARRAKVHDEQDADWD